jgi:hypothetical protein
MDKDSISLLKEWQDDARVLLYAHLATAEKNRRLNMAIGGCSVMLSAIVGTSVFSALGKNSSKYLQILIGIISILAAVLTALHTFLNLSDQVNKHQMAGSGFAALHKQLEQLIVCTPTSNEVLNDQMNQIRERWDKLRADSPAMSARTLSKYRSDHT